MKNRNVFFTGAIVLVSMLSVSCRMTSRVSVTDNLRLDLLPASSIQRSIEEYQLMDGTLPGYGEAFLESYLVADSTGIEMYLFAPTGQTIAVVRYDGRKASMDSEFIPHGDIAAAYMVFDIQMCYAEASSIEDLGLVVSETEHTRTISFGDDILYVITQEGNICVLENIQRAYSYSLETLDN